MILVDRGAEPAKLELIRDAQLTALRALGRPPTSNDISGYRIVVDDLWRAQHYKCCYCEKKVTKSFNDVEHYRPKACADRRPGCTDRHGYWWLAFTWDNLLLSCPTCNRSAKNDQFPLNHGSISLQPETPPPGNESPLLIDPGASINPVEHIQFVLETVGPIGSPQYWWARPRNRSMLGGMTINVCKLNTSDHLELRNDHVANIVKPQLKGLNVALATARREAVKREYDRALQMITAKNIYAALTYDALRSNIPDSKLQTILHKTWPAPNQVGL